MQTTIFINGKFTAQRTTGVQRVASALLVELDRHLQRSDGDTAPRWVLLCPPAGRAPALHRIEVRRVGWGLLGLQAWEQLMLPFACASGALLNLSGSALLLKRRQVCTIHDAAVFDHPEAYTRLFVAWYGFLFRRLSRAPHLLLTVSDFSKRRLMHHLGLAEQRIAVVRSGAEHLTHIDADLTIMRRLGLEKRRFFLTVGSSNANKNHAALARAFAALPRDEDLRLVIAGGEHRGVFAGGTGAQAPFDPRIIHVAAISDAQLKGLYQHAVGLVFPSLYEGYGLPPLEAMACGCPVIAAHAAAIPEVCADAVLYVDPHSVGAIAAAMGRLLADEPLRERLLSRGRQRASELTWAQAAGTLLRHLARAGITGHGVG